MSKFEEIVSINDLNNGYVDEVIKKILPEILDNIGDENTKWNVDRGIDVKIRFKLQNEARETMTTTVEVVPKMAPPKASESIAYLKFDGKGISAHAIKEEPHQMDLDENIHEFKQEVNG